MQRWTALDWAGGTLRASIARCTVAQQQGTAWRGANMPDTDNRSHTGMAGVVNYFLYTLSAALVLCCDHDPSLCKYLKLHIFTMGETVG